MREKVGDDRLKRATHGLLRVLRPRHNEVSNMSQNAAAHSNSFPSGRPVVFRNATVLTIDPSLGMIDRGDVLVVDNRIAEVGRQLTAPRRSDCPPLPPGWRSPGAVASSPGSRCLSWGPVARSDRWQYRRPGCLELA